MSSQVRERFPEYVALIGPLYEGYHEFRSLCHDYGVCVEEFEKTTRNTAGATAAQRTLQLGELQADLETEILERIKVIRQDQTN